MGKHNSKPKNLQELLEETEFTENELKKWYSNFLIDYPNGSLTIDQFKIIYSDFFPNGDADLFADNAFRVFDVNRDGGVDFHEFITALSITRRGTIDERLEWVFNMYDKNANGYISRHEMLDIVSAIYKMSGNSVWDQTGEKTPEKLVLQMYRKMDKNTDGVLSAEEFIEGAKSDQTFLDILQSMIK